MRFAIVLLAACGGAQQPGTTGPTCEQAAANERAVRDAAEARGSGEQRHTLTTEEKVQHCRVDFWSDESIRCFAETKDWEAMKLCYDTLTPAQEGEIVRAIKAKR